jgi:hypothetical protein
MYFAYTYAVGVEQMEQQSLMFGRFLAFLLRDLSVSDLTALGIGLVASPCWMDAGSSSYSTSMLV